MKNPLHCLALLIPPYFPGRIYLTSCGCLVCSDCGPRLLHSPVSCLRMKEHVGQKWPPVSKICKTDPEPLVKIDRMQKITPLRQKVWLHNHQWTLPASTKANAN